MSYHLRASLDRRPLPTPICVVCRRSAHDGSKRPIADIVEWPIKRYRCAVAKRFTIDELEPVAREATRKALEGVQKSFDLYQNDPNLTLGTIVEDDVATFQLYLAGATPADAVVLTAARVSRETGKLLGAEICFEDPAA